MSNRFLNPASLISTTFAMVTIQRSEQRHACSWKRAGNAARGTNIFLTYTSCVIIFKSSNRTMINLNARAFYGRERRGKRRNAESFLPVRSASGSVRSLLLTLSDRHVYLFEERGLRQWHNRLNSGSRYRSHEKATLAGLFLSASLKS